MALSTSLLLLLAIAAVMTALAYALPRFVAPRGRPSTQSGRVTLAAAGLVAVAALAGIAAMTIGFFAYFDDGRTPEGDALASKGAPSSSARADLVRHLGRSPRDGRGWVLLARMDFEADRFADAASAYERALDASPKVASDTTLWCEYADALGMAQGGSLAGKPRELVMRALAQNSAHPKALEMAGSAAFEAGEYTSAVRYWRELVSRLPVDSVERRELVAAIARAEELIPSTSAATGVAANAK